MTLEEKCYFLSLLWRRVGGWGREKGCVRWWITHLHRKRVLKELGWSLRLMSVALLLLFRYFSVSPNNKAPKHNNDVAYLNNKHRGTFFYNFNMFRAAVRREIMKLSFEITIKSRLLVPFSEAVVSQFKARLKLR